MFSRVSSSCAVDGRSDGSIPRPASLAQLHDHGGQLRRVGADGRVGNGRSDRADAEHQVAAAIFEGGGALVTRARTGGLTVVGWCGAIAVVLREEKQSPVRHTAMRGIYPP